MNAFYSSHHNHLIHNMAKSIALSVSLCLVVLFQCCSASSYYHGQQQKTACQIEKLEALEPTNRIKAEAGVTEIWEHKNEQLRCAGVTLIKHTIDSNGLLLPSYTNAPQLIYIIKGRGIEGTLNPGCPERFQSEQGQGRDQHQQIRRFQEGDVIALPAGVAKWVYNDGNRPVVAVILLDTSNIANQLDQNPRRFYLAGNPQQEHEQQGQTQESGNVLGGFSTEFLTEAFGVNTETARKLQSRNDKRGNIVKVEGGLRVIRPRDEREQGSNGLEETMCSVRLAENIDNPSRADIFNPHAGRISTLNSHNLPILRNLRLSAERGVMYKNAIYAPHYNLNAHSVTYVTKGRARIQVVDDNGQAVFDGEVREGQVLVQPQNFAILKQAGDEGFEYISFKTNDNAMINTLAGRTSSIRAMPVDVLANAYGISKEDASKLKFNQEQTTLFSKKSTSERRDVAWI